MDKRLLCVFALLPGLIFESMQAQQQIQPDAKAAVDEVAALFTPNPEVRVAGTKSALATTGSWGVTSKTATDSEPAPTACDEKTSPCVRVLYRVQGPAVECSWVVRFVHGKVKHADGTMFEGVHPEVVSEDENAARYTLRKSWMEGESLPAVTNTDDPLYPPIAQAARVGGDVVVQVMIGTDGKVAEAQVKSGPPMLSVAALDSAKRWQFSPEKVGDRVVAFQVLLTFRYSASGGAFVPGLKGKGEMRIQTVRVGPPA